jgi:hypothetical protein
LTPTQHQFNSIGLQLFAYALIVFRELRVVLSFMQNEGNHAAVLLSVLRDPADPPQRYDPLVKPK